MDADILVIIPCFVVLRTERKRCIFKGITNLFIVNNLEQEYQLIVKGAIIVAAVVLDQWRQRRRGLAR